MQITKADFDNAVKQEWNAGSCIASQAALRLGIAIRPRLSAYTPAATLLFNHLGPKSEDLKKRVVAIFDKHFRNPGDENKPELQKLRASLPITI